MIGTHLKLAINLITKKDAASIVILAVCIVISSTSLHALGRKAQDTNTISNTESLEQSPILLNLISRNDKQKPSLEYLRAVSEANSYLLQKDYYNAINKYTDIITIYGEDANLLYGLAETYFMLGDQDLSLFYYSRVTDLLNLEKNNRSSLEENIEVNIEAKVNYRIAYLNYQKDKLVDYEQTLHKVIDSAPAFDIAIVKVLDTESLDYTLRLFITPIDFTYIARRELGAYYMYTKVDVQGAKTEKVRSDALGIVEEDVMADNLVDSSSVLTDEEYLYQAKLYLISSLAMAVEGFRTYLRTQRVGYEFSDLAEMIELMKHSQEGRNLLQSFDIVRILVGLRKYYRMNSTENPQKEFYAYYCSQLLIDMGYEESDASLFLYTYYPNL